MITKKQTKMNFGAKINQGSRLKISHPKAENRAGKRQKGPQNPNLWL